MINTPTHEEVRDLLEQFADHLAVPTGSSGGEADWIEDREISVSEDATRRLAHRLGEDVPRARTDADRLHLIMMLTDEHEPLRIRGAAPVQCQQTAATVAVFVANTIARRYGLTLLGVTVEEYVRALTAVRYMDEAQRSDAVRNLCRSGEQALISADRPRPNPDDGGIISVGTPISFVTKEQQLEALEVADEVEGVIHKHDLQADIPGRHIHPGVNYPDADLMDRDRTARAALSVASGFVGIDAHLGRRGMGFAVSQMEALGAPVLLMPKKLEDFVFARVFGSRLSHREEVLYEDPADAARHVDAFLRDHASCIRDRHADVMNAQRDLSTVIEFLQRRIDAVDKTLFGQTRMSETRARYLVGHPAHLAGAHQWELLALANLLAVPYDQLAAKVYRLDAGAALGVSSTVMRPGRADRSHASPGDARGAYRGGLQGGLSETEWEAFRAAPDLLRTWDHAKGFILLDEYMAEVSPMRTAARPKRRTDARDWKNAYIERFGG